MKLYDVNGYANMHDIITQCPASFIICVGGRGTGKTYSTLREFADGKNKFMLMRRTQTQLDMIAKDNFSPFKRINIDTGSKVVSSTLIKGMGAYYIGECGEDGELHPAGSPIGYSVALSTISNIRGFDASDVNYLVYDEFIPETHERPLKNEGQAFLNAYETINRNRELQGKKPLVAILLSNANDLSSPLLDILGLTDVMDRMNRKGSEYWIDKTNTIAVIFFRKSPISDKKRNTVLYKVAKSTEFADMALSNKFANANYEHIANRPLAEYRCIADINDIYIWQHKYNNKYYVCRVGEQINHYNMLPTEKAQFKIRYGGVYLSYRGGYVDFSDFFSKNRFLALFEG